MGQRGLIQRTVNKQAVFAIAAVAILVLATVVSSIVSAATLTDRSISPSTASVTAAAGSVEYTVRFTPQANAGAVVIDFCSNSPLIGQDCDAPTGLNVLGADTESGDAEIVYNDEDEEAVMDENTIVATSTMTATEQTIVFTGITNPSTVGTIYARIMTFANAAATEGYESDNTGTYIDSGSVAMAFTPSIAVTGTVLETLTFCVSGAVINANCGNATNPTGLPLGETITEGVVALQAGEVSTNELFVQINTNAASGAVVRLRSSATCGGLMLLGTSDCPIGAALTGNDIDGSEALFGVMLEDAEDAPDLDEGVATGELRPFGDSAYYSTSEFAFEYDDEHEAGVTSPFGSEFLDTNGLPATGKNMRLTFGAAITNDTPAGTYSTDLNMIAVGKF